MYRVTVASSRRSYSSGESMRSSSGRCRLRFSSSRSEAWAGDFSPWVAAAVFALLIWYFRRLVTRKVEG